jgi:SAM-dependent methyltransferase
VDWGLGRYERIAEGLRPAAEEVVALAAPARGERLLDVGCGTGNGSLLAVQRGAQVTGVDPAARLLQVARERVPGGEFLGGEAAALPLPDGAVDLVISVFGVIFAPDASEALGELARVCTPSGRIVLSAWLPGGAVADVMRARAEALGTVPARPPFPWHDPAALEDLLAPHGFPHVEIHQRTLPFVGPSAEAWLGDQLHDHPMWVSARAELSDEASAALRERTRAILAAANEDPSGFRATSGYVVAVAQRRPS